ncbi:hypothetical protein IVB56_27280 [Bradyrhizobium sp. CW7]|uniref:hypothetical protein n=1 Tax=Bradyrhizobium sp. CW7 TaxID=2782688 RepID=UPI001FF7BE22|nr:hypothetical protein [Bradyrhizobium sp. CW7]MCK1354651.1 hypothetical protein [Bradyrhizobium sp. CW7]
MKVSDHRWAVAIEELQQRKDPRELVKALTVLDAIPEWVRHELEQWLDGKLPPDPALSESDQKLLKAFAVYQRSEKVPREKQEDRLKRVAAEQGVTKAGLENYVNRRGNQYIRIRDFYHANGRLYPGEQAPFPFRSRRKDPTG